MAADPKHAGRFGAHAVEICRSLGLEGRDREVMAVADVVITGAVMTARLYGNRSGTDLPRAAAGNRIIEAGIWIALECWRTLNFEKRQN